MKNRIVLSNSYGTRNVGDEAILTVLVRELFARDFAVDVLTFTPHETARRQPEADVVESGVLRGSLSTWKAIRRAGALVVGGGGIIQDATSLGNLLLHVSRPMMASLADTPFILSGVGVGPLQRDISKRLVRHVCANAKSIDARDSVSIDVLADTGVPRDRVIQSADFAHLLPRHRLTEMDDVGRALVETLRKTRGKGRHLIGVSLRPAVGSKSRRDAVLDVDRAQIRTMAAIADRLVDAHDAQLVFVSMHPEQDDPIAAMFVKEMQNPDRVSLVSGKMPPATVKAAVAELDLMIGMRLHSLIFAASHAVPFVALDYNLKVAAYAESLGQGDQVIARSDWTVETLLERAADALERSADIREALSQAIPALRERAQHSIERICAAAQGK